MVELLCPLGLFLRLDCISQEGRKPVASSLASSISHISQAQSQSGLYHSSKRSSSRLYRARRRVDFSRVIYRSCVGDRPSEYNTRKDEASI
jgi:hypothetical protein